MIFLLHALSNGRRTFNGVQEEREREKLFFPSLLSPHPLSQQITIYKPRYRTFYEGIGNFSGTKINGGSIVQTRSFSFPPPR